MKKDTKKKIMGLLIVLIFGLSSIAFFFTSVFGPPQPDDVKPLEKFVLDEEVDPRLEEAYYRGGFTWMKFYYTDQNEILYRTVEQLPDIFKAPDGQTQMVVQRLQSNSTHVFVYSINGQQEIENPSEASIISATCSVLILPPPDCAFLNQTSNSAT